MADNYCIASPEDCINSRQCFMNGEHCSKQMNIHLERKKLHEKQERLSPKDRQNITSQQSNGEAIQKEVKYKTSYEINAFVVMKFSDMSNVVYKWRLKSFIESLKKYLYINPKTHEVMCVAKEKDTPLTDNESDRFYKNKWHKVKKINVIRADSNPASNYVICNRVCQQMQIADIVIVDVSDENTNVFYEFGMAMALGKLILPICYNESFFEHKLPPEMTLEEKKRFREKKDISNCHYGHSSFKNQPKKIELEKHIDCFPWRRDLFEYYGLRFKAEDSKAQYVDYDNASSEKYHFTHRGYACFPYDEMLEELKIETTRLRQKEGGEYEKDKDNVGQVIYNTLRHTYNHALPEDNTLVIYTMDGFMNENEAGGCIVNFYKYMTSQMKRMQCFRGDRVGILVQDNQIKEDSKDSKAKKDLGYNIGNIIHIGMNQATYVAQKERIKTEDFLPDKTGLDNEDELIQFVKEHVGNRSITILPDKPVYVDHVNGGLQKEILYKPENEAPSETDETDDLFNKYYCLYHIMLRTLRYTNEIVVDISNNSVQSLFWLGVAHGSDIHAITVRYDKSDKEKAEAAKENKKTERKIFDVSGLWTAVYRSHDTDGFYRDIMQAQLSIEQHTKLMLEELDIFSERVMDYLYEASYRGAPSDAINEIVADKKDKEARKLESYYRDYFWRRMLRYNHLHIYLPQFDKIFLDVNEENGGAEAAQRNEDPRLALVKWDVDAMAGISHYLSKRKVIGEYYIKTLKKNKPDPDANTVNFVCIGDDARPFGTVGATQSLAQHIMSNNSLQHERTTHELTRNEMLCSIGSHNIKIGEFAPIVNTTTQKYSTYIPQIGCIACQQYKKQRENDGDRVWEYIEVKEPPATKCPFTSYDDKLRHKQLAQLVLWRDVPKNADENIKFQVSLTGASGPATLALSAILVDREQKMSMFGSNWDEKREESKLFLNELQTDIRKTFRKIYFELLNSKLDSILEDGDTNKRRELICAIKLYLSTVLYRYFLPFLTREDEYRICNGMQAFLVSVRNSKRYGYELLNKSPDVEKEVVGCLRSVLQRFKGVEAMYAVKVEVEGNEFDQRKIVDIELVSTKTQSDGAENSQTQPETTEGSGNVTCLFDCAKEDVQKTDEATKSE